MSHKMMIKIKVLDWFARGQYNQMMNDYWVPAGLMPMSGAIIDDIALEEAEKRLNHG